MSRLPDLQGAALLSTMPDWLVALLVLGIAAAAALLAHKVLFRAITRLAEGRGLFVTAVAQRTQGPIRLALIIVAVAAAAAVAPMGGQERTMLGHLLLVGFIVLIGWAALSALHVWSVVYTRDFKLDVEDNLLARKHVTQVRILERAGAVLIMVLTLAAALMTFDSVRQYGVTLLASAGAAGIIAGLALQPLLTNLIAGIQIALTQPIRIDDAVVVEGEWGWIEEIKSAYVVVRLWDKRRLILPLAYFIQTPFQNWTRESAELIGTAMLYVDYAAPVAAMRAKLEEIARGSPLWDGKVVNLAVTDLSERTMHVRCLVGARNSGEAFDLRCEVREKMVAWLVEEHPQALPRERRTQEGTSEAGGDAAPGPTPSPSAQGGVAHA
jgi:small-conductance mechanosensitive channel